MNPPPLNAPFEDKKKCTLKEIMDILDAIPEPKKLDYCPMGVPSSDSSKSKVITNIGKFHEEVATKEINKYLKIHRCY